MYDQQTARDLGCSGEYSLSGKRLEGLWGVANPSKQAAGIERLSLPKGGVALCGPMVSWQQEPWVPSGLLYSSSECSNRPMVMAVAMGQHWTAKHMWCGYAGEPSSQQHSLKQVCETHVRCGAVPAMYDGKGLSQGPPWCVGRAHQELCDKAMELCSLGTPTLGNPAPTARQQSIDHKG